MAKSKRGGARPNSGRKPIEDKKEPLVLYVRGSIIKKIGRTKAQNAAEGYLESFATKLQK